MAGGVGGLACLLRNDLTQWQRIRTTAVPAGMVEAANAARTAGDWRAAAAAARADVNIDLAAVRDAFGAEAAGAVEDDLHHLALDLLWWHLPRHTGGMTTLRARTSAVLAPVRGAATAPLIRVCLPPSPTGPQRLSVSVSTAEEMSDERWFVAPRYMWDVREAGALRAAWGGSAVGIGGNRITVLSCDTAVLAARSVASVGEVRLFGGGGTDLRVGIGTAMAGPVPPNFIVVLTDGLTPWPERAPGQTRVIACLIGDSPAQPPPWITTVRIPES